MMEFGYATLWNQAKDLGRKFLEGYLPGDPLTQTGMGTIVAPTAVAAAEQVFGLFNQDDRPNGKFAPSLSVGDVVALTGQDGTTRFLAVDLVGFREVAEPRQIEAHPEFLRQTTEG